LSTYVTARLKLSFIGSEWRERALAAGMLDYVVKPISEDLIKAKIEKFILSKR
jgi:CheY-like chemotaxis protein